MRIALAHDHLFQIGGAEQVLRELTNVFRDSPIYTLICSQQGYGFFSNTEVRTSFLQTMPGGVGFFKWYLSLMPKAWEEFDFSEFDVVVSSSSAFVKGIHTPSTTLHICYCHTPTRYLWSDRIQYVESLTVPLPIKIYLMRLLRRLQAWDLQAAAQVDFFIANSKFVASRIKKYYGRESEVIYPPVNTSQFRVHNTVKDYYLVVSRLRPYKRVDLVIDAFNKLRLPLIIIGGGEEMRRLKSKARDNIAFLGEVDDATRNKYLAECKAFIHAQEEDFGISAVEAMASGRPVIAYRAGGALETIVDGVTGIFFQDQTWESLAYAVLHNKEVKFDPKKIREHSLQFDASVFHRRISNFINEKSRLYETRD